MSINFFFFFFYKVPPWIIGAEKETFIESTVGKSITLICPAIGTPKPTIEWFKNDHPLELFDINDQYILTNIKQTDEGIYRCIATNKAGTTYRIFNLSVHSNNFISIIYILLFYFNKISFTIF